MVHSKAYRCISLIWIVCLLCLSLKPGRVFACSCAYDPNLTAAERAVENLQREHNQFVFVGEVIHEEQHPQHIPNDLIVDAQYVTFSVQTVYKGNVAPQFTLTTSIQESACGYNFIQNKTYLVFVGDDYGDGSWDSGLCSGNELNPSTALLAGLGAGAPPQSDGDAGEIWPGNEAASPVAAVPLSYAWVWPTAVFFVLGIGIGATLHKRRRRNETH